MATVDETGLLTAVGGGIATISAVSDDSGDSASAVVTVIERVTGVSLNRTTLDMTVGGTFQLLATVQPAGATNKNVVWQSDNEDAVLVDATGKLTAVGAGSANITVTTADGGLTASTNVTVTTDVVPVAGIALSRTSLALEEGEQATLYATISPDNATHTAVTWQSADEDVATVSAGGVVTAVHAGTTVVTVTTADGGKTATADVVVTAPDIEPVAVTGIALDRSVLALAKGQTGTLTATIAPANATNKQVRWRSSDALVATVDATGLVTAVGGGTATITAESADSGVADTAVVTVTEPVTGVTLNQSTLDMTIGGTYRLLATVLPERATNKQIVWRSDNENAARVDTDGNVTAVGAGTASITATTADGGFETRTLVTVSAAAVSATGVELDMKLLRLVAGNTVRLNATVKPADASNKTIVWSSSAPGVATVDVTGLVQAVAAGTASITATTEDGGFTASATVTVQTAGSPATPAPVPTSTPTPTPTPTSSPTPKPTPTSGSGGTPGSGAPFKDIARLVWAADAIQALSDKGIVKGTGEGVFDPDRSITRADIMVLLFRALKLPTSGAGQGSFADVKPGAYYYDAVTAARQLGIAQGSGGRFDPQAEVTREDLMVLIARSLQAAGFAVKPDGTVDLNDYRDANGLSGYAKDSVRWLAEQGIVQGSGGQLLPKDTATRAEAAVIIYRVLQLIEKKTAE
ncbi:Ig-like domain-containing protein [Cohnella ginsengisoli]|uniref:Ig-like domain-containing protein n=1 Tax=Cohnella ginsengisoli TaxID=425004 RepID=A0A9X4KJU1_9BACL|nr:Ig-like domain-containing protein [Cohnella ginsengisoli]MDG0791537.1 Ig-like domain-containing protein [Cohnella ginsengisoli]